jgi:hypothetical protein
VVSSSSPLHVCSRGDEGLSVRRIKCRLK